MSDQSISRRAVLACAGAGAALIALPTFVFSHAAAARESIVGRIVPRGSLMPEYKAFLATLHTIPHIDPKLGVVFSDAQAMDAAMRAFAPVFVEKAGAFFETPARCYDDVLLKYGMLEEVLTRVCLYGSVEVTSIHARWWQQIDIDSVRFNVNINRWWDDSITANPFPAINGEQVAWHDGAWHKDDGGDGRLL